MNFRRCVMLLVAVLGFVAASSQFVVAADEEARLLAEKLRAQFPQELSDATGVLKVRDASGRRKEIPIRFQSTPADAGWRNSFETRSTLLAVAEKLVVVHDPAKPNQYLHARAADRDAALGVPAPVSETMVAFAGSDFWLADLGLEFFHWPEQRLLRKEMRKGRSCDVLESLTARPAAGGYARVLSWIDSETGGLLRAEAYDRDRKLLKEFSVGSVRKINGHWELKELEIRNEQTDSRTRLELDLKPE